MSDDSSRAAYDRDLARLPKALVDRFAPSHSRFLRIEAAAGAILLLSTMAALALSNSPWSTEFLGAWDVHVGFRVGPLDYERSLKDGINDGLMTLFIFLVALDVKCQQVLA